MDNNQGPEMPERIWLRSGGWDNCWRTTPDSDGNNMVYVRRDLYDQLRSQLDQARAELDAYPRAIERLTAQRNASTAEAERLREAMQFAIDFMEICIKKDFPPLVRLREALATPTAASLQLRIGTWGAATFPQSTPESILAHLEEEVEELRDSLAPIMQQVCNPIDTRMEAADCAMLLFQLAHKCKFDLLEAVREKLEINKRRTWGQPDENGVVRHVATAESLSPAEQSGESGGGGL